MGAAFRQGTQGHLEGSSGFHTGFLAEKRTDFIFIIIGRGLGLIDGLGMMCCWASSCLAPQQSRCTAGTPVRPAAGVGHRDELLHVCVCEQRDGDGPDPCRWHAIAARLAGRLADV
jgi:hypothetical protein